MIRYCSINSVVTSQYEYIVTVKMHSFNCSHSPISLTATLSGGQSFRWRRDSAGIWWSTIGNMLVALKQESEDPYSTLYWRTWPDENWDLVYNYLSLDVDLESLYRIWNAEDEMIRSATIKFNGLRILRQPPQECLFAFLCATCNNLPKIEKSISYLSEHYGETIVEAGRTHHFFPSTEVLAKASEEVLRSGLWGYRAPRVIEIANRIMQQGEAGWFCTLHSAPHEEAVAHLTQLHGIGTKLADCICLFSLNKHHAVPVDTHVRQLAASLFNPSLASRSLTPRVYSEITGYFQQRFGSMAGWAQQYLFSAELHRFRGESVTGNIRP